MPEPAGEDRHLKFLLTRAAGYRIVAANGVWGGITPRGDIQVDFFVESHSNPETVNHLVKSDGSLGEELSRAPRERTITREAQVGVLLSVEEAARIASWLTTKVAELKKMQSQGKEEK